MKNQQLIQALLFHVVKQINHAKREKQRENGSLTIWTRVALFYQRDKELTRNTLNNSNII